MINPLVLYTAGGALLVGALGGWTVRDWKADSDQLAANNRLIAAKDAAISAVNKPSSEYEQVLADLRPREIQTRNTIREVYRDVEVPTDCAVPSEYCRHGGLRLSTRKNSTLCGSLMSTGLTKQTRHITNHGGMQLLNIGG